MCIHLDGPHIMGFTHKGFVEMIGSFPRVKLVDYKGALMYPLPFVMAKRIIDHFIGLSGYVCYLLQKRE